MNLTVAAALQRMLAETPAVEAPAPNALGYGRDLWCVEDCQDDFREIGPDTPEIITQALARRFQTPRGALLDDLDYGLDVTSRLNVGTTAAQLRTLQSQAIGECMKDERVGTVALQVNYTGNTLRMSVRVTPRDPRLAPFTFVMTVTDKALELS